MPPLSPRSRRPGWNHAGRGAPRGRPGRLALALTASWAVLAAACSGEGGREDRAGRPRNAILISIDTLRPDHLSCYGHERPTSPTLDALARRGARFTDVTAAAPWTLPSHATMLTGLYPSHHGVKDHGTRLPDAIVTLAEEFASSGFETFGVVNTHNVGAPQYRLGQGFRHFEYISETDEDPRTHKIRTLNMGEVVTASAKALLEQREASKPWFLFLHFYDVHTDFTPDAEARERFVRPYEGKLDGRTQQLNGVRNRGEQLKEADLAFLREMYDAEILTLDGVLGRFLDWLEQEGQLSDTLVLVTSDHGEEFQEHGSVLHGRTQYQELLRVPLILAGPGVPAGLVVDTPVHGVDVTPTLLGLMGVPSHQERDGIDLSGLLRGETPPERLLFAEADQDNRRESPETVDRKRMVRRGAHKLIRDRVSGRTELYDLELDPGEQDELSARHAREVHELGSELERFLAGAVVPQEIPAPTLEDQRKLDAMGYGGDDPDR